MLRRVSDRLLSKAPEGYRPALKRMLFVLAGGVLLFELSRLAAVGVAVAPFMRVLEAKYDHLANNDPVTAVVSLTVTAASFVAMMSLFVFALLRLRSLVKRHLG